MTTPIACSLIVSASVFAAAWLLQHWGVKWLVGYVSSGPPPSLADPELWQRILNHSKDKEGIGARVIGRLELVLSFFAVVIGAPQAVIGGYLAFKVACKWEVWKNVVKVPEELKELKEPKGPSEVDLAIFRARWGAEVFNRFIVGTLANLMLGSVAGWIIVHWFPDVVEALTLGARPLAL